MAGHISGLQQRICARNHRALFLNCDNHSLNLAGLHSAKQDPIVVTFFGTIEKIYTFFSASTLRWEELENVLPLVVKRECETRWSSRAEAVKAISIGLDELVGLLEKLFDDTIVTHDTRSEAQILLAAILKFEFFVLLQFWNTILGKLDRVQKRLQDPSMNFKDAAADLNGLQHNLATDSDKLCLDATENAKIRGTDWGIDVERRIRRRRRMPDELSLDAGLIAEQEIKRVLRSILDRLHQEILTRFSRLDDMNSKFGFLLDVTNLLNSNDALAHHNHCVELGKFYDTDINGEDLSTEVCDCRMLLNNRGDISPKTPIELLSFIISYGDDVFPNLRISLQILLTIAVHVSITSCERSFSKLKLILSYLRSSMGQDRFSNLALLSIERETLECINFDEVIDTFASAKVRRIYL